MPGEASPKPGLGMTVPWDCRSGGAEQKAWIPMDYAGHMGAGRPWVLGSHGQAELVVMVRSRKSQGAPGNRGSQARGQLTPEGRGQGS